MDCKDVRHKLAAEIIQTSNEILEKSLNQHILITIVCCHDPETDMCIGTTAHYGADTKDDEVVIAIKNLLELFNNGPSKTVSHRIC